VLNLVPKPRQFLALTVTPPGPPQHRCLDLSVFGINRERCYWTVAI
jgi:hypothetical protein